LESKTRAADRHGEPEADEISLAKVAGIGGLG
jgi:hypothetical protein